MNPPARLGLGLMINFGADQSYLTLGWFEPHACRRDFSLNISNRAHLVVVAGH